MEGDARYKIEHMGDAFVNMLEKMGDSLKGCYDAKCECKVLEKVPDSAKASLDVLKKVPAALIAPFGLLKKIPVGNPLECLKDVSVCNPLDMMKKVPDAAKSSARGVILTYDIHELKKKKDMITKQVGERIVELRKESPEANAADDETVRTFLLEIDAIDSKLDDYIAERKERLYPAGGEKIVEEASVTEEQSEETEAEAMPEAPSEANADEAVVEETAESTETIPETQPEASVVEEETTEAAETETNDDANDEESSEESGGIEVLSPEVAEEEKPDN